MRWLVVLGLLITSPAWAAGVGGYTVNTVSINSASTPVAALPYKTATITWMICSRTASAVPVLCFPYTGTTVPSVASPGAMEIPAGQCREDGTVFDSSMTTGWACVLESGTGAVTVDVMSR